ncbi:MAG: Ribonucleoside-diphosphate reductase NrdZ [Spirochaetes bacterium ADurb.Bin218]|nr:MAG: Ribonucleoside-diphosphate reductase NrdZ [Spirochaetes bacterium ADurb.Bin218]
MREDILRQRYYNKNEKGQIIEDWAGLCNRVANSLAETKKEKQDFYEVLLNCLFLPNSPTLMNAGKNNMSYSACFVLPVEDSIENIFEAIKETALIHKSGGGTGFDFSRLRPAGDIVSTTKGVASGPCSFIQVFNAATDVIKQGSTRRGANMGLLRVNHPDIMEFINMKKQEGHLANFNISIAITDTFMKALEQDGEIPLVFNDRTYRIIKAKEIWDAIIEDAWRNGEPGVIFIDEVNRHNTLPHLGEITSTNPCGEQPLLPYEACVLGSVNLARHIKNEQIDWTLLESTVKTGIRMLDNIIDIQAYPLPEIEKMHKANRKIGLGVMGWADMLLLLKIRYDSEEALILAEKVMAFIEEASVEESGELAKRKGTFQTWKGSVWEEKGIPIRNATTTTIAPTGTLSIIAECSSGIEPVFAWETIQKRPVGEHRVVHPIYKTFKDAGKSIPEYFVTASEIAPEWHIKMQAAFQKHTHNAVSKTINLPNSATKEDVEKAFRLAHSLCCKGITVYRDGSRMEQVISSTQKTQQTQEPQQTQEEELRTVEEAKRIRVKTSEGNVYVIITHREATPLEVFIHSPVESKYAEIYEAFARVLSTSLRHKIPLKSLLEQLEKANTKFGSIVSPVYAVLRAFRMLGMNGYGDCPECGNSLIAEEGCLKCFSCGYSKC